MAQRVSRDTPSGYSGLQVQVSAQQHVYGCVRILLTTTFPLSTSCPSCICYVSQSLNCSLPQHQFAVNCSLPQHQLAVNCSLPQPQLVVNCSLPQLQRNFLVIHVDADLTCWLMSLLRLSCLFEDDSAFICDTLTVTFLWRAAHDTGITVL